MPTITTNGTGRHSANYDSLGTLQMLEVSKGILPREYSSWDEINHKIPAEWRDGCAVPISDDSMLRTPQAKEGEGGAVFEDVKRERGNHIMVRDQVAQLALENGLPVSEGMAMLPTVKARDAQAEGYEAGLRRAMPQLGTMVKAITDGDERIDLLPTPRAQEPGSTSHGYGDSLNDFANRVVHGHAPKDLLPTPNTMEHREIKSPEQIAELKERSPGGYRNLRESVVNELLPTPIVRDYKDGSAAQTRDGKVSTDTVARAIFNSGEVELMGTPRTSSANGATPKQIDAGAPKARIEDQVLTTNWGKFEPAIRRWEAVLGRPAPAPTKSDGKDGSHRLSSKFTEWMMGLPDGWITDVGLTRVEELKACGNGVVPQQAELALRVLLQDVKF